VCFAITNAPASFQSTFGILPSLLVRGCQNASREEWYERRQHVSNHSLTSSPNLSHDQYSYKWLACSRQIDYSSAGSRPPRIFACSPYPQPLIDAANATLPRESPRYQTLRRNLRASILDTITDCPETFDTMYIPTEFRGDNDPRKKCACRVSGRSSEEGQLFRAGES
jgi:hypothetical protein